MNVYSCEFHALSRELKTTIVTKIMETRLKIYIHEKIQF